MADGHPRHIRVITCYFTVYIKSAESTKTSYKFEFRAGPGLASPTRFRGGLCVLFYHLLIHAMHLCMTMFAVVTILFVATFELLQMHFKHGESIFSCTSERAYSAVRIILTVWDEFKSYPYDDFYRIMMKPAFLFDGRGIVNHGKLEKIGFEVHAT